MAEREIQTENEFVRGRWQYLKKPLGRIVKGKGGEVKTCGVQYWTQSVILDDETCDWAKRGMAGKPSRWLLRYDDVKQLLTASEKMSYFSLRNEALAFVSRIFVGVGSSESEHYSLVENTEWLAVFVASQHTPRGSSSAVARADGLGKGYLTISTDDRKFRIPLDCVGLIPPGNRLEDSRVKEVHDAIVTMLDAGPKLYELKTNDECEAFLARVDALKLPGSSQHAQASERSWMTAKDLDYCRALFDGGNSNLVLWGDESSALEDVARHIEDDLATATWHVKALPDWDHRTLSHLASHQDLSEKIVFVHAVERVDPELVLAPLVPGDGVTSLIDKNGTVMPAIKNGPKGWVLLASKPQSHEVRRLHRTLNDSFKWFRCEGSVDASQAVTAIYEEEGVTATTGDWPNNLFVLMWEEFRAYLPIPPEVMASVVRHCLRTDMAESWDLDASPTGKETLVRNIEAFLTPYILAGPREVRIRCINALAGTLEFPVTHVNRLLALTLVD